MPPLRAIAARGAGDDAGFTMVEAIVSLTIFVIIAVAATAAIVSGTNASTAARNRVTGTHLVQYDLEQARAQPSPAPTSYSTAPAGGSNSYTISRSVTMPSPSNGTACPAGQLIKISSTATSTGGVTVTAATVVAC